MRNILIPVLLLVVGLWFLLSVGTADSNKADDSIKKENKHKSYGVQYKERRDNRLAGFRDRSGEKRETFTGHRDGKTDNSVDRKSDFMMSSSDSREEARGRYEDFR